MTDITITLDNVCAGGTHARLKASVNGGAERAFVVDVDDLKAEPDEQDIIKALLTLLRLSQRGKTRAQARSALQAGVTVSF